MEFYTAVITKRYRTAKQYEIPAIDLVIVDLYPFEETVATADEEEIIEKIDIGGISLIRGAAKNLKMYLSASRSQYDSLLSLLEEKNGGTDLADRKRFAMLAFAISSHYDTAILTYFNGNQEPYLKQSVLQSGLRYGENPHQAATFYGDLE